MCIRVYIITVFSFSFLVQLNNFVTRYRYVPGISVLFFLFFFVFGSGRQGGLRERAPGAEGDGMEDMGGRQAATERRRRLEKRLVH